MYKLREGEGGRLHCCAFVRETKCYIFPLTPSCPLSLPLSPLSLSVCVSVTLSLGRPPTLSPEECVKAVSAGLGGRAMSFAEGQCWGLFYSDFREILPLLQLQAFSSGLGLLMETLFTAPHPQRLPYSSCLRAEEVEGG